MGLGTTGAGWRIGIPCQRRGPLSTGVMNFNLDFLVGLYRIAGRETVRRALTIPSGPLVARAKANKDDPSEIIAKRDAAANALLDLVEEYANVDED